MSKSRTAKRIVSMTFTPQLLNKLQLDPLFNANKSLYIENTLREKLGMKALTSREVPSS